MKNALMAVVLGFCLLNLTGCMGVASPVAGWAYTEAKWDGVINDGPAPTKTGTACATSILAMVATGDASLRKAMRDGNITKIKQVNHFVTAFLGFVYHKHCTIVIGE